MSTGLRLDSLGPGQQLVSKGFFPGQYEISLGKHMGRRSAWAKVCYVFSGQGANFPGMLEQELKRHLRIKNYLSRADDLAQAQDLPAPSLYITAAESADPQLLDSVELPCLFTLQVAIAEILREEEGRIPDLITAHSFGEYAALVEAGVLEFEDAFGLVCERERRSPLRNSRGFMVAVGGDTEQVTEALGKPSVDHDYHFSNYNSPRQTVISVAPQGLDGVEKALNQHGLRALKLNVPQPYHSPFLVDVKEAMARYIGANEIRIKPPHTPVLSSVTGRIITAEDFAVSAVDGEQGADGPNPGVQMVTNLLIEQIVSPVRFASQIESLYEERGRHFIEIGPAPVLKKPIDETLPGREIRVDHCRDVLDPPEINGANRSRKKRRMASKQSGGKIFAMVNSAISKVTGYELHSVSMEDRFIEDLSIDSIKQAEIVFTVIQASGIEQRADFTLSSFQTVEDLVTYIENARLRAETLVEANPVRTPNFARWGLGLLRKDVDTTVAGSAQLTVDVVAIDQLADDTIGGSTTGIAIVCSKSKFAIGDMATTEFQKQLRREVAAKMLIISESVERAWTLRAIALVTDEDPHPLHAGFVAFFKSLKKEHPQLFFKHIAFDRMPREKKLKQVISQEFAEPCDVEVVYRRGRRNVRVLEPLEDSGNTVLEPGAVIVAPGGAGGVGTALLEELGRNLSPHVIIMGRAHAETSRVRTCLSRLQAHCASVTYERVDVGNYASLELALSAVVAKRGKVDLVLNNVGVQFSQNLINKSGEAIMEELEGNLVSAFNISKLALEVGASRVIHASSVAGRFGNNGQTVYAYSKEAIARLCEHLNAKQSKTTFVASVWPPWDEVGMTARGTMAAQLRSSGVMMLSADKGRELFAGDLLDGCPSQVVYFDEQDRPPYEFLLKDLLGFNRLLGLPQATTNGVRFVRALSPKTDTYLQDHAIDGAQYLPAAIGISMFLCAGRLYFNEHPMLRNVSFQHPVVMRDQDVPVSLEIALGVESELVLELQSIVKSFSCSALHLRDGIGASALRSARGKGAKVDTEVVNFIREIGPGSLYRPGVFFHGPSFQSLARINVCDDEAIVAEIDSAKLPALPHEGVYGRLSQWLDGAFQVVAAHSIELGLGFALPYLVREVRPYFNHEITDTIVLRSSNPERDGRCCRADILMTNSNAEILMDLRGVELKAPGDDAHGVN